MGKPITGFSLLACACGIAKTPAASMATVRTVCRGFCFMCFSIRSWHGPQGRAESVAGGGVGIQGLQLFVRAAEQRVARLQEISMTRRIGLEGGRDRRHR